MEFPIPEFPISGGPNGRRRDRPGALKGASLDPPIVAGLRGALVVGRFSLLVGLLPSVPIVQLMGGGRLGVKRTPLRRPTACKWGTANFGDLLSSVKIPPFGLFIEVKKHSDF